MTSTAVLDQTVVEVEQHALRRVLAEARPSLVTDCVEEVRITDDDHKVSALFRPGTESAKDLHRCSDHYSTVVHFSRMQDLEPYEKALAAVELFHPAEFLEEAELVAA